MTVSTQTSRADYTGNGATTAFTVPFYFLDSSHVQIIRTQISTGVATTLALTTDYTLSGAGVNAGGTATMVTAPTADQRLTILRNVPFTQLQQYVPNDPFPAASHERALDLLTMEVQQLYENISRSLTLSANSSGVSAALPSPQAGTLVGWNGTATALQNYNAGSLGVAISYAAWQASNFSGDGVTTSFIIPTDAGVAANCAVSVGGVVQAAGINYSYNATTRTIAFLTGAPPVGVNNVNIRYGQALAQGTVASASITDSTTFGRSVLTAASASAAGLAASGANGDITSLTALTAGGLPDNSVLTADIANGAVTPAKLSQPLTRGTAVNTTSGVSVSYTSIPNWVNRITLMFNGVSSNGASGWRIQLGTGGSPTTSGYDGASGRTYAGGPSANASASGFDLNIDSGLFVFSGAITFTHAGGNLWLASGTIGSSANIVMTINLGGKIALAGVLDNLILRTINGTDTFDAGSINIIYE